MLGGQLVISMIFHTIQSQDDTVARPERVRTCGHVCQGLEMDIIW